MAEKRQLELYLLRFLPHALRDDFVTIGFLLLESDGGFAEFRLTRDWKMLQVVAPNVESEWFGLVESEVRKSLSGLARREELVQRMNERFGLMIDVSPAKAVLTEDPVKEMDVLTSIYLLPPERGERVQQRTGRTAIIHAMKESFANSGVLELVQQDIEVDQYTGAGDPFRIDFGYRVGNVMKMFQALSVASVDQAVALAHRYSRIETGMQREQMHASMTAVVDQGMGTLDEKTQFAIGLLAETSVRVRTVSEMPEIADEVRRELRV
jgi:Protein of unknown function (DUF3037)